MIKRLCAILLVIAALSLVPMSAAAKKRSSPYRISVDLTNQIVTVRRASSGKVVRQFLCSSGMRRGMTPTGKFHLKTRASTDRKPWYHISPAWWVRYATRITGHILFHSVLYHSPNPHNIDRAAARAIGSPASHGCVRLKWQNAKWIAQKCPNGTLVHIYNGSKNRALKRILYLEEYRSDSGLPYEKYVQSEYKPTEAGMLGRGSSKASVRALQARLKYMGFMTAGANGVYGNTTIAAVLRYQQAAGLEQTGTVSAEQYEQIMRDEDTVGAFRTLTVGDSGSCVRRLQENLAAIGLYRGATDGVYRQDLCESVAILTHYRGLAPSRKASPAAQREAGALLSELNARYGAGNFGIILDASTTRKTTAKKTVWMRRNASKHSGRVARVKKGKKFTLIRKSGKWSKIKFGRRKGYIPNSAIRNRWVTRYTVHWGIPVEAFGVQTLDADSIGPAVEQFQQRLRALGFYAAKPNAIYDAATADAVCAWQSAVNLTPDGVADVDLQEQLLLRDDITGTAVPLAQGDEGPAVAGLQRLMKALGYYDGDCAGSYDDATAQAVLLFTRSNGFSESDAASPSVQQAIRAQFEQCESAYGNGNYHLSIIRIDTPMAKMKARDSLYARMSAKSRALASLKKGRGLVILEQLGKWSRARCGGKEGWVRNRALRFYTRTQWVAEFNAEESFTADGMVYGDVPIAPAAGDEDDAGDELTNVFDPLPEEEFPELPEEPDAPKDDPEQPTDASEEAEQPEEPGSDL